MNSAPAVPLPNNGYNFRDKGYKVAITVASSAVLVCSVSCPLISCITITAYTIFVKYRATTKATIWGEDKSHYNKQGNISFKVSEYDKLSDEDKRRYGQIINKVSDLAKRFGIKNNIRVLFRKGGLNYSAASAWGPFTENIIFLPQEDFETLREKEFLICHELSHIKNRDSLKSFYRENIVNLVSLIFMLIIPQIRLYILFVQLGAVLGEKWIRRKAEKRCDLEAKEILGTGVYGATWFLRVFLAVEEDPKDLIHPKLLQRVAYLTDQDIGKIGIKAEKLRIKAIEVFAKYKIGSLKSKKAWTEILNLSKDICKI